MTGDPAPAVSVVIPTRNRAQILPQALRSVLDQVTEATYEVVVVDNASEDGTAGLLEDWRARDPRVRSLRETSIGRTPAIVRGTAAAAGSLLLFTDDDVIAEPGWIEAYVTFFRRHPDVSLAGGPVVPIPAGPAWPAWFSDRAVPALGLVMHDAERPLGPGEHVWGANMAARPALFDRVGGWRADLGVRGADHPRDPGMNEDIELQYRVRSAGQEVWFCPAARIGHRAEPRSPGWCLRRGFGNGRNSYHRRPWPGMPVRARRGRRSIAATAAWTRQLVSLCAWSARFRAGRDRRRFERAWIAAWSTGWCMEDLLADDRRDAVDRSVRAVTARVTRVAARLAGTA